MFIKEPNFKLSAYSFLNQYYSVDGSGKVTRNRKECPNCGKGYFMARHMDRHYCGKCGLTLRLGKYLTILILKYLGGSFFKN